MQTADVRNRTRRRQETRIGALRQRLVVASTLGFAAFFGLAAHHALGSSKRRAAVIGQHQAVAPSTPTSFFDQRDDGYAFDDGTAAVSSAGDPSASPTPADQAPPVAQTSVS